MTSKPHGRDCPDKCSQCRGAVPRRISQDGPALLIDGSPAGRALDRETSAASVRYGKRGKTQSMKVTRRKA